MTSASSSALPTVSVVVPCWNAEGFVARAIQSVLDQQDLEAEIIVIDDGSTDRSVDVLKSFGDRINWRTGPNRGACAARNAGLALARSMYVLFLDADDYISPDYLQNLKASADRVTSDICFGKCRNPDGSERVAFFENLGALDILSNILDYRMFQTSQLLWRAEFVRGIGGWDELVKAGQDTELSIRALLSRPRLAWSPQGYCVWTHEPGIDRISRRRNVDLIASGIRWLQKHHDRIKELKDQQVTRLFASHYYSMAISAYRFGMDDQGAKALERRFDLGVTYHEGGLMHRMAATLLGLRMKERIAAAVRKALGKG